MASVAEMKAELQALIDHAEATSNDTALSIALQTGRLDLVTILLTSIAVILAIGGLMAYFDIRSRVPNIAERVAREECRKIAEDRILEFSNDELPNQVRRLMEDLLPQHSGGDEEYGAEKEDER